MAKEFDPHRFVEAMGKLEASGARKRSPKKAKERLMQLSEKSLYGPLTTFEYGEMQELFRQFHPKQASEIERQLSASKRKSFRRILPR